MPINKYVVSLLIVIDIGVSFPQVFAADIQTQVNTKASFQDVADTTAYSDAIAYVKEKGIVQGFGDNSYRPDNTVTRAELLKMILLSDHTAIADTAGNTCFPDVESQMWYAKYICYAQQNNIINGYPDGSFKPNQPVSYNEALKITMNTLDEKPQAATQIWYKAYQDKANQEHIAVPAAEKDQQFNRGEMAELLTRTLKKKNNEALGLSSPKIIMPAVDETLTNYPREAKLTWTAVTGADVYEFELACDYCVSISPMWQGATMYKTTETSFLTPPLAGDNQFRFHVRAVSYNGGVSDWSDYRYFRYDTRSHIGEDISNNNVPLLAPTIVAPESQQVLTQFPRVTKVAWTGVENAYKYEVELACDICSSITNFWQDPLTLTTQSTFFVTQPLWGDNKYRVRVRAVTSGGVAGPWSDYRFFSYDTSGYALTK